MEKGTWVVCINDSNWPPEAYIKMSGLPVKNELYQVREFVHSIPGLLETDGIKLEGIYGEESYSTSTNGKKYWLEDHFRADRFQVVDDLWSFLTEESDVKKKATDFRRNHQKLLSALLKKGYEDLTDEEKGYWHSVY